MLTYKSNSLLAFLQTNPPIVNLFISPDPPEIITRPVDQVVWVGQQVTLFCDVAGNPVPKIVYSIVGENGTVGFGKTLVINSSSTAYVKTYICTAMNGIKPQATAHAKITVLGKLMAL